jgi:hypothetical protein
MTTSNASFSSFEEAWALYLTEGGLAGYTSGLPGMTTKPHLFAGPCAVHLCKSDPRAGIVYPNAFSNYGFKNATYEPTTAEYTGYVPQERTRLASDADGFEAVDLGAGQWVIRNKLDITFDNASAGTGCTLTHALFSVGGTSTGLPAGVLVWYGLLVAELDVPVVIPNGGGAGPVLTANTLVFEVR